MSDTGFDDSLYSRQVYVLGKEAMARIATSSVMVVGLGSVGVEVAKNLLLAGISRCTLFDPSPVTHADLSGNFFAHPRDVGQPRATVVEQALAELNPTCQLSIAPGPLTSDLFRNVGVVVFTDLTGDVPAMAAAARAVGTPVVIVQAAGLAARCFCDFGEEFVVHDATGEEPAFAVVTDLVDKRGGEDGRALSSHRIDIHTDGPHNLGDGDFVEISDLRGKGTLLNAINGSTRRVRVISALAFSIELDGADAEVLSTAPEADLWSDYVRGGFVRQVKQTETVSFRPYADACAPSALFETGIAMTSFRMERQSAVHAAFLALEQRLAAGAGLPRPWDTADAAAVADDAVALGGDGDSLSRDVYGVVASAARGVFSPLCAIVGGFGAQQAMIALTGKFSPLRQWAFWECFDLLETLCPNRQLGSADAPLVHALTTSDVCPATEAEAEAEAGSAAEASAEAVGVAGGRLVGQVLCLGRGFSTAAQTGTWFLVGAGALGCEYLKQFALMGIGAGPESGIVVTDNDNIERSNLSRQFLFRAGDVGRPKSEVAAAAARAINPATAVQALTVRVGPDSEDLLDSRFFTERLFGDGVTVPEGAGVGPSGRLPLGGVVNALDNLPARRYMDERCVSFGLPLVEAGTLGSKANMQIVVPFLTENYGASADPEETGIPQCTLHNFPSKIDHTIMWAKDLFSGLFGRDVEAVAAFARAATADAWAGVLAGDQATAGATAACVRRMLTPVADAGASEGGRPASYADCVALARALFEEEFANRMKLLLHLTPLDHVDQYGVKFWSGSKRPPSPAVFDATNAEHERFIDATARIYARIWSIVPDLTPSDAAQLAAGVTLPAWTPPDTGAPAASAAEGDDELVDMSGNIDYRAVVEELRPLWAESGARAGLPSVPEEFEKDDDSNSHVAFVTAASNLRAACYEIEPADFAETKRIAGRIIPAMITTTALIVGYGGIEHAKLIAERAAAQAGLALRAPAERLARFTNTYVNIGIPIFSSTEPIMAERTTLFADEALNARAAAAGTMTEFSLWSTLAMPVSRRAPLGAVMAWLGERFGASVAISMLAVGSKVLWDDFFDAAKKEARLSMAIEDAYAEAGAAIASGASGAIMIVAGEDPETYEEARIPELHLEFTD